MRSLPFTFPALHPLGVRHLPVVTPESLLRNLALQAERHYRYVDKS